ncbi:TLC domain-containing protein 4-B isoform X1 [Carya illinoinensis]|uniref:TLC domain-containing protein 4-B isoform X1 n=1 Tax=Carya illinoinensis TaxID=32201 RepID=UPI001C726BED|nr:TLC domain-containing protein 4-B isoform X1 [Carya illinoinensis]XP_042959642.1 TLC domain-containing protein 4-B isoform X1 [Carya illinoinensis]XP_042959643.1 TLC domain-containing protein 4-B isoform X1 [Carya illinoinensis]
MIEFPLPHNLLSDIGYVSPIKVYHWLASVFSGILVCIIVSVLVNVSATKLHLDAYSIREYMQLTGRISLLCFKGYGKLSTAQKVEWNNRGFSTFHALLVAFVSLYLLLLSDTFDENSDGDLLVRRTSALSDTLLGFSIGYFVSDLAMILWLFPALGGLEYVLHHGLSMFSIFFSLISGQVQFYILMVLFSESTTPFVNLRWYLDVAGQKNSSLYIFNGVALFLGWLVARILLFIYFFVHMFIHFDQVKKVFPLGFYSLLVVPPVLAVMNVYWFWKIAKGFIKTITKARHRE